MINDVGARPSTQPDEEGVTETGLSLGSGEHATLLMVTVLAITVVPYVFAQILQTPINKLIGVADRTLPRDITEATLITIVSGIVVWRVVIRPLRDQTASAQKAVSEREA